MLEYLGQTDQRHFAIWACHFNDLPAERLPEGVGGKIVEMQVVCGLDLFEFSVDCLNCENVSGARQETGLRKINNATGLIAVLDVALEALVDPYLPALACFLFKDDKLISRKKLAPPQLDQIGEA